MKKMDITRPRPDGGVTRNAPGALDPAVFLLLPGSKIITVTQDTSPSGVNFKVDDLSYL